MEYKRKTRTECDSDDQTIPDNKGAALENYICMDDLLLKRAPVLHVGGVCRRNASCNFEVARKGSVRWSNEKGRKSLHD